MSGIVGLLFILARVVSSTARSFTLVLSFAHAGNVDWMVPLVIGCWALCILFGCFVFAVWAVRTSTCSGQCGRFGFSSIPRGVTQKAASPWVKYSGEKSVMTTGWFDIPSLFWCDGVSSLSLVDVVPCDSEVTGVSVDVSLD